MLVWTKPISLALTCRTPLWQVGRAALRGAGLDDAFVPLQQLQSLETIGSRLLKS